MRIVLDTNIWVSAYLWGGLPRQVIFAARNREITLLTSAALLDEIKRTFAKPKFVARLTALSRTEAEIDDEIENVTQKIEVNDLPEISRDQDDNQVLACAIAGKAFCIVSGDGDLLDLKEYEGIKIMTAAEFLQFLEDQP